jgi:hypothetical protein
MASCHRDWKSNTLKRTENFVINFALWGTKSLFNGLLHTVQKSIERCNFLAAKKTFRSFSSIVFRFFSTNLITYNRQRTHLFKNKLIFNVGLKLDHSILKIVFSAWSDSFQRTGFARADEWSIMLIWWSCLHNSHFNV